VSNRLHEGLARVTRDLDRAGRGFALVGGIAVSVRTEPRLTRDLDLVVAVANDRDAESLVHALVMEGYEVRATVEQEGTGRLATMRLVTPGETVRGVVADLLFASSGIEAEIVAAAERLEILPRLFVPVASTGHLVALKLLARDDRDRPQDADDLRALRQVASRQEFDRAREAVRLIVERGFGRGRDLDRALEEWLAGPR
jgi:predicted nucleotidyltransferase